MERYEEDFSVLSLLSSYYVPCLLNLIHGTERSQKEGSKRPSLLGVLWYPRVRYCFDENNELFSRMDMASFEKEVIPNDPTPVRVLTSDDWVNRLKEQGRDEYLP